MSDNFVQKGKANGTTTASLTMNGVAAGNTIIVFGYNNNTGTPATLTCADGQATYTKQGAQQGDAANGEAGQAFSLVNANAGTHVIVVTTDSGSSCTVIAAEISTSSGVSAVSGANSNVQTSPGTGGDAITSGSVVVIGAATIVGLHSDSSSALVGNVPTVGTGFSSRDTGTDVGAYILQTGAFSANHASTATAITGTDNFLSLAVAVLNGIGAASVAPVGRFIAPVLQW